MRNPLFIFLMMVSAHFPPSAWAVLVECAPDLAALRLRASQPVSSNRATSDFDLGRETGNLEADPLRDGEQAILKRAGLTLFPAAESFDPKKPADQFSEWASDLDAFLIVHRNDPAVRETVQRFLVDFTNNPRDGALPGDGTWTRPRKITDWRDLYRLPRYYDLEGNLLRLAETNSPITPMPEKASAAELKDAPTAMVQVYGNLRNAMGFLDSIKDGSYSGPRAQAKIVTLRRIHLTIRLLEEGQQYLSESK